jgi:hypothetical protein
MGMGWGARHVWWWILPRWQARHPRAQAVTFLESPRHTNLDKMIKNGFPAFKGDNGVKSASENISSQASSACLAES